jgi:pyridoxine 4-dehydrogenase
MTDSISFPTRPGGETLLAGHPVARIGYGVMQLGDLPGRPGVDADSGIALLRRAVEVGINHFDTAQFYGAGVANDLLRRALAPYADDIVLVSKVGADAVAASERLTLAQKPHELRASVEANLASLGTERIAVVNLRRADVGPGLLAAGDQVVDLDDQLAEMVALRDEGKIGAIGLSNVRLDQLERALPAGIVCVQNPYSVLDRSGEALLDLCLREEIAWVPYFPLGSAFPGMPKVTDEPAVRDAAETLGATPAQVGVAWLLQHAPNILLISGTKSIDHLVENTAAGDVELTADIVARLDALSSATTE